METKLTLKEKDKIVKKIYRDYQRAQLDILYLNQHYNYFPQIDVFKIKEESTTYQSKDKVYLNYVERKQELENYVSIVNQLQSHLTKEALFFIENEYLNFYDRNWWTPYYSRASYYREKHKALNEFLEIAMDLWGQDEVFHLLS